MSSDSLALRDNPFKITPDTRFFYRGRVMQSVYDSVREGVFEREGLLLVAGEAGTGKTTLLLKLKEALESTDCLVVFPRSPVFSFDELISACCQAAGVGAKADSRLNRIRAFTDVLVRQVDQGRATAVLIDDAEELNDDFLADLSRLTAIEKGGRRLVQIVLAGHHELVQRLSGSELPFVQECAIGYRRLAGLDRHEVADYIAYRLARVGREGAGFDPAAVRRIAQISKGVPQVINQLCGMCLHIAELEGSDNVTLEIVEATAPDFLSDSASAVEASQADEPEPEADEAPAAETVARNKAAPAGPAATAPATDAAQKAAQETEAEPQLNPVSIDWRSFRNEMKGRAPQPVLQESAEVLPPLPSFYRHDVQSAETGPPRRVLWIALMFVIGSLLGGAGAYYLGAWPSLESDAPVQTAAPAGLPEAAPGGQGVEAAAEAPAAVALNPDPPARDSAPAPAETPSSPRLDDQAAAVGDPQLKIVAPPVASAVADKPEPAPAAATAPPAGDQVAASPAPARDESSAAAAPETPAQTAQAPSAAVALAPVEESPASSPIAPQPEVPSSVAPVVQEAAPTAVDTAVLDRAEALEADPDLLLQRPRPKPAALLLPQQTSVAAATPAEIELLPRPEAPAPAPVAQPRQDTNPATLTNRPLALVSPAETPTGAARSPLPLSPAPAPSETEGVALPTLAGAAAESGAAESVGTGQGRAPLSLLPLDLRLVGETAPADTIESEPLAPPRIEETAAAATLSPEDLPTPAKPSLSERPEEGVIIQFAALRSESDAGLERERLNRRFGGLLQPFDLGIVKADVNGVAYYRVRSAPVVGRGKAYDLCAELRKSQQGCMVIHPDGFVASGADDKLATAFEAVKTETPGGTQGLDASGELKLLDFVVARDVQDREPVDPTGSFVAATDQAFAHAKVRNAGPRAMVAFVWRYDDALISRFETEIGTSARWRTWSSTALQPGPWKVQLVSADGQVLGERPFIVE